MAATMVEVMPSLLPTSVAVYGCMFSVEWNVARLYHRLSHRRDVMAYVIVTWRSFRVDYQGRRTKAVRVFHTSCLDISEQRSVVTRFMFPWAGSLSVSLSFSLSLYQSERENTTPFPLRQWLLLYQTGVFFYI
jgi:hypothetical protein